MEPRGAGVVGGRGPSRAVALPPPRGSPGLFFPLPFSFSPGPAKRDPGSQRGPAAPPACRLSLPPARLALPALPSGRAGRGSAGLRREPGTAALRRERGGAAGGGLRAAAIAPSRPPIPKKTQHRRPHYIMSPPLPPQPPRTPGYGGAGVGGWVARLTRVPGPARWLGGKGGGAPRRRGGGRDGCGERSGAAVQQSGRRLLRRPRRGNASPRCRRWPLRKRKGRGSARVYFSPRLRFL